VIRKAVAERKKRYQSLDEMAKAIEEIQARPSEEEERLILATVASSSAPAKKLAKVDLAKMAVPSPFAADPAPDAQPHETPAQVHPVFAEDWDPLEAPPAVFFENGAPDAEPGVVEMKESEAQQARQPEPLPPAALPADDLASVRAELKERREEILVLESRLEHLARVGARISALEEKLKEAPGAPSLVVQAQLNQRRFAAAERSRRNALIVAAVGGAAAGALALALVVSLSARNVPVPQPAPPAVVAPVEKPAEPAARAEPKPVPEKPHPIAPPREQRQRKPAPTGNRAAAAEAAAQGDKALRSFNTKDALAAFESALKLDPTLPAAHRGMGMVYVLQGKNADAKVEYQKYLQLAPDAPDADQIKRLLAR
jgi:tetratricopeptide (TPR) repeat protein